MLRIQRHSNQVGMKLSAVKSPFLKLLGYGDAIVNGVFPRKHKKQAKLALYFNAQSSYFILHLTKNQLSEYYSDHINHLLTDLSEPIEQPQIEQEYDLVARLQTTLSQVRKTILSQKLLFKPQSIEVLLCLDRQSVLLNQFDWPDLPASDIEDYIHLQCQQTLTGYDSSDKLNLSLDYRPLPLSPDRMQVVLCQRDLINQLQNTCCKPFSLEMVAVDSLLISDYIVQKIESGVHRCIVYWHDEQSWLFIMSKTKVQTIELPAETEDCSKIVDATHAALQANGSFAFFEHLVAIELVLGIDLHDMSVQEVISKMNRLSDFDWQIMQLEKDDQILMSNRNNSTQKAQQAPFILPELILSMSKSANGG